MESLTHTTTESGHDDPSKKFRCEVVSARGTVVSRGHGKTVKEAEGRALAKLPAGWTSKPAAK